MSSKRIFVPILLLLKNVIYSRTVDKFLLGSKELLVFDIIIPNYGEDAFEASFFMVFPKGLNFRKVESRDSPVTCTAPTPATNMTLKCDLGNPLSAGKSVNTLRREFYRFIELFFLLG